MGDIEFLAWTLAKHSSTNHVYLHLKLRFADTGKNIRSRRKSEKFEKPLRIVFFSSVMFIAHVICESKQNENHSDTKNTILVKSNMDVINNNWVRKSLCLHCTSDFFICNMHTQSLYGCRVFEWMMCLALNISTFQVF